ncbi:transporter substrate-binding domain-containing protein [Thalassotalea sp. LPB0316]|uniref:substrate-binding periplasmic protein n=1 Tax=Thalassotalea sp. LPB0316 TaxID=2769490 RepID=UPI0018674301|nr:transporter substrate-binding domain-containing protein [Thalassotalea sp. LPB0316]QOL24648.1 transporter substrate-binding domain-containing protein [Thalassotalea sp. LPB0316]
MTLKRNVSTFVVCVLLCCAPINVAYGQAQQTSEQQLSPIELVIPGPLDGNAVRNPFIEDLLKLVFKQEGYNLSLVYFKRQYTQGRALRELEHGSDIDLNWSTTSIEREQHLRAIRFPLYRGLIGWRVALIRQGDDEQFARVTTLDDLKQYLAVQRFDWTDFDVFKENDLPIEGNFTFATMSKAVRTGLVDYFPRSVLEIGNEIKHPRNNELAIEQTLLFKYPAAYYFFVNKKDEALAQTVESGLIKAFKNGSYQILFNRHFGESLALLNLDSRKIIHLTNSTFPDEETVERFWYK